MTEYTKEQIEEAREFLKKVDLFFEAGDINENVDPTGGAQTLNMNDVWAWAGADGEYVPDNDLPKLQYLYKMYGWCGILYYVSKKRNNLRSEFVDNNRFIDFVDCEERIREQVPDYNERAYAKMTYTLGEWDEPAKPVRR